MTQLGELQDALPKFRAAGLKLYAVSYDAPEALAAFAAARGIEFPLLSDADSTVIRAFGILNTLIQPDDVPFYGIPFPGTYLVDEAGIVRYQACDDRTCLIPRTERLQVTVPVAPHDVPNLDLLTKSGHKATAMDSATHLDHLIRRFLPSSARGR